MRVARRVEGGGSRGLPTVSSYGFSTDGLFTQLLFSAIFGPAEKRLHSRYVIGSYTKRSREGATPNAQRPAQQMHAQRYVTTPVVHACGGLKDSVTQVLELRLTNSISN